MTNAKDDHDQIKLAVNGLLIMRKVDKKKIIVLLKQSLVDVIQIKTSIRLSILAYQFIGLNYSELEKDLERIEHTMNNLRTAIETIDKDIKR